MKIRSLLFMAFVLAIFTGNAQQESAVSLSQDMLTSLKMNQPVDEYEKSLENIPFQALVDELNTDHKKFAFWINVYITYGQKLISSTENAECDNKCKKQKVINIAGRMFSLNDILYRILLHSKCTVTGGKKPHSPKWEKMLRVGYPDGRVLLAIDSDSDIAAEITYYEPENLDNQLNIVSLLFIKKFVYYNADTDEVYIPKWIKNFKREFGKTPGIYAGLRKAEIIKEGDEPKIIYSDKIATLK